MQTVSAQIIANKKVLLRYDIDVQITAGKVTEDFKLSAGLPTLKLCLENASQVILMGHLGRPEGRVVAELSVEPVRQWFASQGFSADLQSGKFKILENLRFDPREEAGDPGFAKELAAMGEIYVNEAFGSYRPAVSTTVLPSLLPHYAGINFAKEIAVLSEVKNNPKKPFVAIMGGAKVKEKLPVIEMLAQKADAVLVGGKLVHELRDYHEGDPSSPALPVPQDDEVRLESVRTLSNIFVGRLNEDGLDIASETVDAWSNLISRAVMIIWNGPLGKFEEPKNDATKKVAQMLLESNAKVIIGGGDTVAALGQYGLLQTAEEKTSVSVGGGAMLKFLTDGTLPTIEALK
ncbi:phosphoglycerate kinase [Candidatus Daviesbacteria bacterium]|nr:phosphoglycerate kinase [Candidatus Daviesbacteria bacterium]